MRRIPARYTHLLFGVIQSGVTSGTASGIASFDYLEAGTFLTHWIGSWLVSWMLMLPLVVVAAPVIQRVATALTDGRSR